MPNTWYVGEDGKYHLAFEGGGGNTTDYAGFQDYLNRPGTGWLQSQPQVNHDYGKPGNNTPKGGDGTIANWDRSNASNIDRYGNNVGKMRDIYRKAGFSEEWGDSNAQTFAKNYLTSRGFTPSLNGVDDMLEYYRDSVSKAKFSDTEANTLLPDNYGDDIMQRVIDQKFSPYNEQLTNAQKRGTLNQTGLQAALSALGNDKLAAKSTMNSTRSSILGKGRQSILDALASGRQQMSQYDPYGSFDPDAYRKTIEDTAGRAKSSFESDLMANVNNLEFTDYQKLLNAGGKAQGSLNNKNPDVIAALADREKDKNTNRGLGSEGEF